MEWPISWEDVKNRLEEASLEPTILDLDTLGVTTQMLSLMNSGGGSVELDIDHATFWKRVQSNKPIMLVCTVNAYSKLELNIAARTYNTGIEIITGFCGLAILHGLKLLLQVDFEVSEMSNDGPSGTLMTVTVFTLTNAGA